MKEEKYFFFSSMQFMYIIYDVNLMGGKGKLAEAKMHDAFHAVLATLNVFGHVRRPGCGSAGMRTHSSTFFCFI